ncbi:MAG TPA: hypothetical protein VII74_02465 [Chthoniobacterales bacterium]
MASDFSSELKAEIGHVLFAVRGADYSRPFTMSWEWDPLRKDPRFAKILAGPEPATIYH